MAYLQIPYYLLKSELEYATMLNLLETKKKVDIKEKEYANIIIPEEYFLIHSKKEFIWGISLEEIAKIYKGINPMPNNSKIFVNNKIKKRINNFPRSLFST